MKYMQQIDALTRLREFKDGLIAQKEMDGYLHLIGRSNLSEGFKMIYQELVYQGDKIPLNTQNQFDAIQDARIWIDSYLDGNIDEELLRHQLEDTKRIMDYDNLESQIELDFRNP
jgi:hypothetical protein